MNNKIIWESFLMVVIVISSGFAGVGYFLSGLLVGGNFIFLLILGVFFSSAIAMFMIILLLSYYEKKVKGGKK